MLAYLYGILEDAEDGGAAARHGGVESSEVVEPLLDGCYVGVECKNALLEIVEKLAAPGFYGLHDDVAAVLLRTAGRDE